MKQNIFKMLKTKVQSRHNVVPMCKKKKKKKKTETKAKNKTG